PAGWQFMHRGCCSTLTASVNKAADRVAVSAIAAKLSTLARLSVGVSETACAAIMVASRDAIADRNPACSSARKALPPVVWTRQGSAADRPGSHRAPPRDI